MRTKAIILIILMLIGVAISTKNACADGINGSIELDYDRINSKTTDASGESTRTKTNVFLQRYNLDLEKTIYPYLKLRTGGIFEKDIAKGKTDGTEANSTITKINPQIDLTLQNPFYTAGVNYNKLEEKDEASGTPSVTNVREIYRAIFGLRPEGLPYMDMQISRTNTYDKERLFSDNVDDYASLNLRYRSVKDLDLQYFGTYNDLKDRLNGIDSRDIAHTGRANYSTHFFDNRVYFNTNLSITHRQNKTTAGSSGEVPFQAFPFSGLSALDDTPVEGALDQNPALIDGNLTAGSGINIGPVPVGGDNRPRNIGLDFFNATELNTLYVWVDRQVPVSVANSFSWDIYTSSDNLNWSFLQTVSAVQFGTFDNRFEIDFSQVTTRYIKLVTNPLPSTVIVPPGTDLSNIFVTELQAFLKKPAQEAKGSTTSTIQLYDVDVRTILLQRPYVYYDLYYVFQNTDLPPSTTSVVTNSLNLSHPLSRFFSINARIARDDGKDLNGKLQANSYNASLRATPLPTLSHSLVFSGRSEKSGSESTDTNSVFLYNYAELYKGINVNLSGGYSVSKNETGRKDRNVLINFGASLVPNSYLTLDINYSGFTTKETGGGREDTTTFTRRSEIAATFTPLQTVYLVTSFEVLTQNDRDRQFLQHYAAIWSPFRNGDLQFNFSFSDDFNTYNDEKDRTIVPSIRWNISRRSYVDVSYNITKTETVLGSSEYRVFSVLYKMLL